MLCVAQPGKLGGYRCHLPDAGCQSHRLAARGTFASELLASTASLDQSFAFLTTLHEMQRGALTPGAAKRLRERGGYRAGLGHT